MMFIKKIKIHVYTLTVLHFLIASNKLIFTIPIKIIPCNICIFTTFLI